MARYVGPLSAAVALVACNASGPGSGGAPNTGDAPTESRSTQVRLTAPTVTASDAKTLASDDAQFAWDVYQKVRTGTDNLVFSPASISIALAMTYAGARGETASQMATALHFSLPPERLHPAFDALDLALESPPANANTPGSFQLTLANALWAAKDLTVLPSYLDLLAQDYGAGVEQVDFGENGGETARLTINKWVSDKTASKIPALFSPGAFDAFTTFVLTNAVYFKADWQRPFKPDSPMGTFQAASGPVQVPMMAASTEEWPSWGGTGYRAAALPYQGGTTSMIVVVPDAGAFNAFESGLTAPALEAILTAAPSTSVNLSLPRFKLDTLVPLTQVLQSLGMTDAFTDSADLSGIDGGTSKSELKSVVHEAMIAVDEKGTEAAAATGVTGEATGGVLAEPLVVDRPFLFAIRDDATGAIVFLGRVLDPSK